MFYAATALLGGRGLWRSKHQGVIAAFGEHFVKSGLIEAEYGRFLSKAFQTRLGNDYKPGPRADPERAQQLVEQARHFVGRVIQFLETEDHDAE